MKLYSFAIFFPPKDTHRKFYNKTPFWDENGRFFTVSKQSISPSFSPTKKLTCSHDCSILDNFNGKNIS